MNTFLTFVIGLAVRILLPVGVTLVVFYFLRRLDQRWQKEALQLPVVAPSRKPCWEVKNCPEEKRSQCAAARQPKVPCWQVFRTRDGVMKENCLGCTVFRQAPVQVHS